MFRKGLIRDSGSRWPRSALVALLATLLTACGGGGSGAGSSGSTNQPSSTPSTPAPPANRAPTISGSPLSTLVEGNAYSFQPAASDPDGDALIFSAVGLPAWLAINGQSGLVTGVAPIGSAGSYGGIVITVSDGKASASLSAFTLVVSAATGTPPPNAPPTISGTPPTSVIAGQLFSFQPTASDPDSATLRFGVANKPAWAGFDVITGRLAGTPAAGDAGSYPNIVISVSDGTSSATLPAFTIIVIAPPTVGVAELQWTAPTQNEDGTALTNLAGYKVRYGASPAALDTVVDVANPGATNARIEGLAPGTWYFTVACYTNTGVESAQTGVVSKTIT